MQRGADRLKMPPFKSIFIDAVEQVVQANIDWFLRWVEVQCMFDHC